MYNIIKCNFVVLQSLKTFQVLVKFYFNIYLASGFSLGDELGFPESLGNVEGGKKRSLDIRTGGNSVGVLPAVKMPVS